MVSHGSVCVYFGKTKGRTLGFPELFVCLLICMDVRVLCVLYFVVCPIAPKVMGGGGGSLACAIYSAAIRPVVWVIDLAVCVCTRQPGKNKVFVVRFCMRVSDACASRGVVVCTWSAVRLASRSTRSV